MFFYLFRPIAIFFFGIFLPGWVGMEFRQIFFFLFLNQSLPGLVGNITRMKFFNFLNFLLFFLEFSSPRRVGMEDGMKIFFSLSWPIWTRFGKK